MHKVLEEGHSARKSFAVCGYLMGLTAKAIDISTACWNWHRLGVNRIMIPTPPGPANGLSNRAVIRAKHTLPDGCQGG
jgi:hypothetical protein